MGSRHGSLFSIFGRRRQIAVDTAVINMHVLQLRHSAAVPRADAAKALDTSKQLQQIAR